MLERMLELMRSITKKVSVVSSHGKYSNFGAEIVEDRWPGEGPLGGIVTALLHTLKNFPNCEWNFVVSCDMPFLTQDWMMFLAERAAVTDAQVLLPHSATGPEPLCACWRTNSLTTLQPAFERGVRKVMEGVALLRAEVLDERDWKRFDNAGRLFWNMNTLADYEEARRILQTGPG